MTRIFLSIFFLILISCSPDSRKYEKDFDIPLMKRNEMLRLSGEYDSLVDLNKKYYKKADKIGYEDGKALCYINLAQINISLENYQKAQLFFNDAGDILKHSKNNLHKAVFYNVYSNFNKELKKLDKAFEYNSEAMDYIKESGSSELKNSILSHIYYRQATYLVEKKQYQKALDYFQKQRKLDQSGIAECAISDYIYMQKNRDSAYKYISIAYNKVNEQEKNNGIALYANTIMGEYYITDKQYDKAEIVLKKALEIDKKTKRIFANYTKYIYNDLRTVYENKGENEKAYFYLKAYTDAKNKTNTSLLKTINQDMEFFIRDREKDSEDHENKIKWVMVLSLVGFSLFGIYTWRIINLLRKKKKDLNIESEQLKIRMNDKNQDEIMELAKNNDPAFLTHFKEAYPDFIKRLLAINPNLENSELAFCALLKLHFTSKEIANYTLVQHRSVQQKKYRIRKRLNVPTETDTYQFFDDLN